MLGGKINDGGALLGGIGLFLLGFDVSIGAPCDYIASKDRSKYSEYRGAAVSARTGKHSLIAL